MREKDLYNIWVNKLKTIDFTDLLLNDLISIENDPDSIYDRFYKDIEFGTGGLRAELGAGTNRINYFTIGKVTQGLCNYLTEKHQKPSLVIAYDTRNYSREFSEYVAKICCAKNITTYVFDDAKPTPMLSFAVRHLKASAGIVITASHNPKEYNGYKVYGEDGVQLTDKNAKEVYNQICKCTIFDELNIIESHIDNVQFLGEEIDSIYYNKVKNLSLRTDILALSAQALPILYTPLYGAGKIPVPRALKQIGFSQVEVLKEQEGPNGNFPTTPYPNPEIFAVFDHALTFAKNKDIDLIFATDPDCDRIGMVSRIDNQFVMLTGNQIGILMLDYIINALKEKEQLPANAVVIKTIVTTDLADEICKKNNIKIENTLTGFKYIGEKINSLIEESQSFLFGFEESYGYLVGDFVRDKDAIIASALIAEMFLYYKTLGTQITDVLESIYKEYGFFTDKLTSFEFPGQDGQIKISNILAQLRANYATICTKYDLHELQDYENSKTIYINTNLAENLALPKANVIKLIFDDKSWVAFRPSGTEPKIKIYFSARGTSKADSEGRLAQLEKLADLIMNY